MPERPALQLAFPGLEPVEAAPRLDRLFFAVMPDPAAALRIDGLAQSARDSLGVVGGPLRRDRFHITVVHVDDYDGLPPRIVEGAMEAAERTPVPDFDVVFDALGSFSGKPGRNPLVLTGGEGLSDLKAWRYGLWERLHLAGVKPVQGKAFNPHVTLLYGDRIAAERPVEPVRWAARELLLIHSEIRRTTYNILGRWSGRG